VLQKAARPCGLAFNFSHYKTLFRITQSHFRIVHGEEKGTARRGLESKSGVEDSGEGLCDKHL
jgi:hypothetical protein